MIRNKPDFCLIAKKPDQEAEVVPEYKVILDLTFIFIRKVKVSDDTALKKNL